MVRKKKPNVTKRFYFIFIVFAVFSFSCSLIGAVVEFPKPTSDFYVGDFGDVLSNETKEHIIQNSEGLYHQLHVQLVVVTIETLGKQSIEQYAITLAREWGIGDKESNKGLLILISKKERAIRIEIGKGLEGDFNDAKVGRIIRDCSKELKSSLDVGIKKLYDIVLKKMNKSDSFVSSRWSFAVNFSLGVGLFALLLYFAKKKDSSGWFFVILYQLLFGRGAGGYNYRSHSNSNDGGGGHFSGGGASGKF
ncbi:MAG: TPM domain-containing protein [Oscillospiraceae bacterium]|jgi:uncharacterized protein|nr:TPM domain-containing protein [Oscillospiraceae bacterium]